MAATSSAQGGGGLEQHAGGVSGTDYLAALACNEGNQGGGGDGGGGGAARPSRLHELPAGRLGELVVRVRVRDRVRVRAWVWVWVRVRVGYP